MKSLLLGKLTLGKRHALTISRGTNTGTTNLYVGVQEAFHLGLGEATPGGKFDATTAEVAEHQIREFDASNDWHSLSVVEINDLARSQGMIGPALAALDMALWDLQAKKAGLPLYDMLGLPPRGPATSITVGLNEPDITRELTKEWLSEGYRFLKIKLGSPNGIEFDKGHFEAAREAAAPFGAQLRVDANGGWSLADAIPMSHWLAERDVDYIEQPLHDSCDHDLPALFQASPLPIFADESVRFASDVVRLKDCVHGVNLKLMKCGGITEALRIIHTARACGLQTMIGCMSEGSIGIAAGAALNACFDHIDLDSHHNLAPDPAEGLLFEGGVVLPPHRPGLGVEFRPEFRDTLGAC